MTLMCLPVYNLEPYEYFRRVVVDVYEICKGYIFPYEILQEDLLAWKVYYTALFIFLFSHMFPWMNKFLITENIFLPRLIKQESYRSSHCIFRSF